jgi:hypothetical protein
MADDIRYQRRCFFVSPEYAASFWGRYIYIYEGKGSLRLTTNSLRLEAYPGALEIPFHAIKSIGLERFSSWAKPFGLSRLTVSYLKDGEPETIYLVPYESVMDPTWETSKLVASWLETLGGVEELSNRVEPPQLNPVDAPSIGLRLVIGAFLVLIIPLTFMISIGWLMTHR